MSNSEKRSLRAFQVSITSTVYAADEQTAAMLFRQNCLYEATNVVAIADVNLEASPAVINQDATLEGDLLRAGTRLAPRS